MTGSVASRIYHGTLRLTAFLAGASFAGLAVMISLDVVLRNIGIVNFPWLLEISEYALYGATFLAAPWVLSQGAHVRVDLLRMTLPKPAARLAEFAADGVGALLAATLMWFGGRVTWDTFQRGDLLYKELVIPEWTLLIVLPISGALLTVEFLRRLSMVLPLQPSTNGEDP